MKYKSLILFFSVIMLVIATANCSPPKETKRKEKIQSAVVAVRVVQVEPANFYRMIEASGIVESEHDVTVLSETSGRVISDKLVLGKNVKKGQALVVIDPEPYRIQLDQAKANVAQAKSTCEQAKIDLERSKQLHAEQLISDSDFDQVRFAYERAVAAKQVAEAQLQEAQRALRLTIVRAPFAGQVASRPVQLGDTLAVGTAVTQLVDTENLKMAIGVGEDDIAQIQVGQQVKVKIPTAGLSDVEAQVVSIGVKPLPPSMTYPVELKFIDPPEQLRPGMIATAQIPTNGIDDAIIVSVDSIIQKFGKTFVFIVEGNVAHKREVEVGPESDAQVVILAGLQAGEMIVVSGQDKAKDGATVNIVE